MSIQRIFVVMLLAVVAAAGWRFGQSATFQRWIAGSAPPSTPIEFDNGTARVAGGDPEAPPASAARPSSGVRKCARGSQVSYTDGQCPPGTRELDLTRGTVTVVPGSGSPPPPAANGQAEPARRKNIRDVMLPPEETAALKEKRIEQVVGK